MALVFERREQQPQIKLEKVQLKEKKKKHSAPLVKVPFENTELTVPE